MDVDVDQLDTASLRRLRATLEAIAGELGSQVTIRQALALVLVALSNKSGRDIGVAVLDRELGDLSPGTSSKVVKAMVHVTTPRKGEIAGSLDIQRDPEDLRKWNLYVTQKGVESLNAVLAAMTGRAR